MLLSWIRALRLHAHANIAPPLVVGQALAYFATGRFEWRLALWIHAFGLLDHFFIVLANDYADREVDALNDTFNAYSGGSRVIVEGKLSAGAVRGAALFMMLALLGLCGAFGYVEERPQMIVLGLVAVLLLWAYSYPPLKTSYRGYGELTQGLGVGLVLPLVGFYGQTGELMRAPFLMLVPTFVLGFGGNIVTALPDTPSDKEGGKRTWSVTRGEKRARRDAIVFVAAAIASMWLVSPTIEPRHLVFAVAPPAVLVLLSLRYYKSGDAEDRAACFRFVTLLGGAITVAQLAFAAALYLAREG